MTVTTGVQGSGRMPKTAKCGPGVAGLTVRIRRCRRNWRLQRSDREINRVPACPDTQRLRRRQPSAGKRLVSMSRGHQVLSVTMSADSNVVAASSQNDTAAIWEVDSGAAMCWAQGEGTKYGLLWSRTYRGNWPRFGGLSYLGKEFHIVFNSLPVFLPHAPQQHRHHIHVPTYCSTMHT